LRNLYTIAVVRHAVARELRRLRRTRPEDWAAGAGERLLAVHLASAEPLVASYRVVLDGWDRALEYLPAARAQRPCKVRVDSVALMSVQIYGFRQLRFIRHDCDLLKVRVACQLDARMPLSAANRLVESHVQVHRR